MSPLNAPNGNRTPTEAKIVLPVLALLFLLSLAVITSSRPLLVASRARDTALVREVNAGLPKLRGAYEALRGDLRPALARLQETTSRVDGVISPFQSDVQAAFSGAAANARAVRGLIIDGGTSIPWFIRDVGFCFGPLSNKQFEEVTLLEIMWTGFLLRIDTAAADAIDADLDRIWVEHAFDRFGRGDPGAFAAFARDIRVVESSAIPLRRLSDLEYDDLVGSLRSFVERRNTSDGVLGADPLAVRLGVIDAWAEEAALELAPTAEAAVTVNIWFATLNIRDILLVYPVAALLLNFVGFSLWRQGQQNAGMLGRLRFSALVGIHGNHAYIDRAVIVLVVASVILAYITTLIVAFRMLTADRLYAAHAILAAFGLTACCFAWISSGDVLGLRGFRAPRA